MYLLSLLAIAPASDPAARARDLAAKLTLDETVSLLHGHTLCGSTSLAPCNHKGNYTGFVPGIERLGVPALTMNDGPQGFRDANHPGTSTCWPSGMSIAATWDPSAARRWGVAMGTEFRQKGANVQLGPGLNVARIPQEGRNFEYLSGEEAALGVALGPPVVEGIQSNGIIATAKHYILNSQENDRGSPKFPPLFGAPVSEVASERTRWEVYMPPFEAAVRAGVGSVMCAYNRINGTAACGDDETLTTDLKQALNFSGWVMSDWFATHSAAAAAVGGLDQEMPLPMHFSLPAFELAILEGRLSRAEMTAKAVRILTPMFAAGLFDRAPDGNLSANVTSMQHAALARSLAANSTVLLRNAPVTATSDPASAAPVLPIGAAVRRIAVLGAAADATPVVHGRGSGAVAPPYVVTPLAGIRARNTRQPTPAHIEYLVADGSAGVAAAATLAAAVDLAIVVVGDSSTEGADRATLALSGTQDALVAAVAAAQPRTVAVVAAPGPVLLPWAEQAAAVVVNWMAGQEAGHALADVLYGDVDPSGRLPHTLPNKDNETRLSVAQYPGVKDAQGRLVSTYTEGNLIGYKYYDAHGVAPHFGFGFGLSFTKFGYSGRNPIVSPSAVPLGSSAVPLGSGADIAFAVSNLGERDGIDVPQCYVSYPPHAAQPPKLLRAFARVDVRAGAAADVALRLTPRDLAVWDTTARTWQQVAGRFTVACGPSSRELPLSATLDVGGAVPVEIL